MSKNIYLRAGEGLIVSVFYTIGRGSQKTVAFAMPVVLRQQTFGRKLNMTIAIGNETASINSICQ